MRRVELLKKQQALLKKDIAALVDRFLIGTIAKSPSLSGYNLTTKAKGTTRTLYVPKRLVPQAVQMSQRYRKLWQLMQKMSQINWDLLKREDDSA
jgi:hypothetical protein